ncbi:hypothetical protein [Leptospirillum ferrooxidans]|jgi:hypothetical protein|uniref:Uncharacterized protein n=1 Tax=Leptospirillum ferrooxidans (strain C2-3) TaxID=1162668 RepID=I0IQ16_LEPFC|nr:hypothetical protein [Leptospirillum ferrooxidans]BAM07365.1 hypothetical protein LFE_1685 [Leptospirillum ferrooxidans C2-3]
MEPDKNHPSDPENSEIPTSLDDLGPDSKRYCPGIRNLNAKGRALRGFVAFFGFVAVIVYNERWPSVLDHPLLFTIGLMILSFITAITFLQSFLSFCVVDAFLGRTNISGRFEKVSQHAHELDKKRAFLIIGGALVLGILFSALLLIKEIGSTV